MAHLNKKSKIVEVFTKASTQREINEVLKSDYKDALKVIQELASNPNPNNRHEISQIVAYTVDNMLDIKTGQLFSIVGESQKTGFTERPKFKIRKNAIQSYWQAPGSTPERSRIGYAYQGITADTLTAVAAMEYDDLCYQRIEFDQMLRDITNDMNAKMLTKVESTLYTGFSAMSSPNYGNGTGINKTILDALVVAMSRFGKCTIIGDLAVVSKLADVAGFANSTATGGGYEYPENLMSEFHNNGYIGVYRGANVIALENHYMGLDGFNTPLKKNLLYIVPAQNEVDKALKIWEQGEIRAMEATNINDASYEMRFDKNFGAGLLTMRNALAVYEDTSIS